ncbi:hypothetical protein JMM61_15230 [Rhodovulum sulfidophilum]|uniref:hypothetical protein n=1 Tax=Rhodovulum sulfidophilum TaxID=35806 RepID=UPI0019251E76|nr:hypothetical protein [Rhodovulum sulfidophilum]MBL3586724.1 hypothetical protein [Rhodovulum sulfidophilum]
MSFEIARDPAFLQKAQGLRPFEGGGDLGFGNVGLDRNDRKGNPAAPDPLDHIHVRTFLHCETE